MPTSTDAFASPPPPHSGPNDHGFGLIEVVLAMSLIAGAYLGVLECYQRLFLRYGQLQAQMTQLHQQQNQHEMKSRSSPQNHHRKQARP
ncbi:MAG: hypothetical protein Q8R65_09735 [Polynucleobacter sp.]|nr:hypothetical protein [Polynucleobacter sp.]MDZ4056440.1 hypothetical protein [Polynucleobacter sp.]